MKRFLAFLLVFVLAFSLVACGEDENSKKADDEEVESTDKGTDEGDDESTDESTGEASNGGNEGNTGDVLTPEEIFTTLEGAGGHLKMTVEIPDMMTMVMESENDENGNHAISTVTIMGMTQVEETYTQWVGEDAFVYSKDEDGNWTKEQVEATENEKDFAGFSSLFTSEAYEAFDSATGRYVMKEGFSAEMDTFVISNGYLEIKDGTYTVYGEMSMSMDGLTVTGTMTIEFKDLGEVTVTFPEVAE